MRYCAGVFSMQMESPDTQILLYPDTPIAQPKVSELVPNEKLIPAVLWCSAKSLQLKGSRGSVLVSGGIHTGA